jgi:rhodanese-related sulfurtransferase
MMAVFPFQDHRFTTGSAPPPAQILTDVRRTPTFGGDEWMIVGAIRGPPDAIAELGTTLPKDRPVIVYCARNRSHAEWRFNPPNETDAIH